MSPEGWRLPVPGMSADRLFQTDGPATANDLAPTVDRRTGGTTSQRLPISMRGVLEDQTPGREAQDMPALFHGEPDVSRLLV